MTNKTFVSSTVIDAAWLNDVNTLENVTVPALASSITTLNGATGAASVGYTPAGTGAVASNVQTKLRESVSVKDFGAVGDGVTDDTAAIQAAINATQNTNNSLFIPGGTYKVSNSLNITLAIKIFGAGSAFTNIKTTSSTLDVFNFSIGTSLITGCELSDLTISSSVTRTNGAYIKFSVSTTGMFYKTKVKNISTDSNTFIGISVNSMFFSDFENIVIGSVAQNGKGFDFQGLGVGNECGDIYIKNCRVLSGVAGTTTLGFHFGSFAEGFYIFGCTAESNGLNYGFVLDNSGGAAANTTPRNYWFNSCIADSISTYCWYFTECQNVHLNSCWGTTCLNNSGLYLGNKAIDVTVSDGTFINNGTNGINLDQCATIKIYGCTIAGNSRLVSNTSSGIIVNNNTSDFIFTGNRFNRKNATASHLYDIYLAGATINNFIIANNILDGFVTQALADSSTGNNGKIHDNQGVNPSSTMGFPTVTASPYTYTSGHTPESVYVSGGTVSSITQLTQPLFSTTGVAINLGPNESITITYTVAPTLRVIKH